MVLITSKYLVDDCKEFPYGGLQFVYRNGAIVESGGERERETGSRQVWPTTTLKFDTHHRAMVLITSKYLVNNCKEFPYGGLQFVYRNEAIIELGREKANTTLRDSDRLTETFTARCVRAKLQSRHLSEHSFPTI